VSAIFVSGATGYLGRALIPVLLARGHKVRGLIRTGSEKKLPSGCEAVAGNALDTTSFAAKVPPATIYVHLVGAAAPAPWKEQEFQTVDLGSLKASVEAARTAGIRHFVFVSVAQPAPVMRTYIEVRAECEAVLQRSGIPSMVLRPWYVLGPGRRWPLALVPIYKLLEAIPATREGALRLGLVTIEQMTDALAWAIENPADGFRILDVPAIRSGQFRGLAPSPLA
jgi:uncharacterized protein YbjT (DUF2867 family)